MKVKPLKNLKIRPHTTNASAPSANLRLKTILATTDFSGESLTGVRYAMNLAEKLGANVALLHVVEPVSRLSGMESVVLARGDSEVLALARAQLAALAKREGKADVIVTPTVRTGKPFHEITAAARKHAADLIVIATHGHTGLNHLLLGSTAERVVRHAACPVLTVPTHALTGCDSNTPALTLKRILVPTDFSIGSIDAFPYAVLLAGLFRAKLIFFNAVEEFPIDHLLGRELTNETMAPMLRLAEADLEGMAANLSRSVDLRAAAVVRQGKPAAEICHTAASLGVDLIVLATHGYTGLKHVWLGSTAERVVRHAPCPVLAVHSPAP